jgi:hypothetical protein
LREGPAIKYRAATAKTAATAKIEIDFHFD